MLYKISMTLVLIMAGSVLQVVLRCLTNHLFKKIANIVIGIIFLLMIVAVWWVE